MKKELSRLANYARDRGISVYWEGNTKDHDYVRVWSHDKLTPRVKQFLETLIAQEAREHIAIRYDFINN